MSHAPAPSPLEDIVVSEAGRCVLCGQCLSVCPTYALSGNENESPRGRIVLMGALARGQIPLSPALESHLDHCLSCGACERGCPSRVRYGRLMEAGRALLRARAPGRHRLRDALFSRATFWRGAAGPLRLYRGSGLQAWLRRRGWLRYLGLQSMDRLLATSPANPGLEAFYSPRGEPRGAVGLFTGCLSPVMNGPVLRSAIDLLTRLGYEVRLPPGPGCCGALHRRNGDRRGADRLARRNRRAFGDAALQAVVCVDSGCGAALTTDVPGSAGTDTAFGKRVRDISAFLHEILGPDHTGFRPLSARVAVHEPCTLRNTLKQEAAVYRLLARIPELTVLPLPGNETCCGGAGTYPLDHPDTASALLEQKLESLRRLAPDLLLTSNIGCRLHLQAGLEAAGIDMPVMHAVELLQKQLQDSSGK